MIARTSRDRFIWSCVFVFVVSETVERNVAYYPMWFEQIATTQERLLECVACGDASLPTRSLRNQRAIPQSWKMRRGFISSHKALMISSYLLAGYPKDETDRKFINDEA